MQRRKVGLAPEPGSEGDPPRKETAPGLSEAPMTSLPAEERMREESPPLSRTAEDRPSARKADGDVSREHLIDLWLSRNEKTIANPAEATRIYEEATERWEKAMSRTFNIGSHTTSTPKWKVLSLRYLTALTLPEMIWHASHSGFHLPPDRIRAVGRIR